MLYKVIASSSINSLLTILIYYFYPVIVQPLLVKISLSAEVNDEAPVQPVMFIVLPVYVPVAAISLKY
jgi:hypothetical protein